MKISLITACYNSAGTIGTAIESVLSQKGVGGFTALLEERCLV